MLRKTWRRPHSDWYLPAMTPSETALDQLADLPATVKRLTQELVVLRTVMDEIREDIVWAVRDAPDSLSTLGARRINSMALDPCAPDWSERLNRLSPSDLPPESGKPESRPNKILVRAEDFARAMENIEQLVYCCESPDLQWTGDPEVPGVECRKCGYIVAQAGSVAMNLVDEETTKKAKRANRPSAQGTDAETADDESIESEPRDGEFVTTNNKNKVDEAETTDAESSRSGGGKSDSRKAAETPRRRPTQPLSMRLIFQPHMTDLVRVFGYATLSQGEAKRRAEPLIEKYGRDRLADAVAEIVEEVADPPRHCRLTDVARRFAVQILGKQPAQSPIATNVPSDNAVD